MLFSARTRWCLLSGIAALTIPAMAQAAPAAAAAAAAEPAPTAEAPAADPAQGLGDIVVTATRRETNLQRTPIAISVVDPTVIKDRHVQSLIDLADGTVPSLRVATFEARQSALTIGIRGIVPFDQNQTARDTGVGVYIDGVYLGRSQGLNAALFDVARLEVLRGPQGTLFGRNTEGGALSIVTKGPSGEFGGRAVAGVGNYGSYNGELHLDLPEVHNVAVKLDGVVQHQDPTTRNPLSGQAGWNQYQRVGGRITALWKPVDGVSAEISYDQAKDENTPFYSQLVTYNPNGYNVGAYNAANVLTFNGAACNVKVSGVTTNPCIAPLSPLVTVSGGNRMSDADIGVPQQVSVDRTHGTAATLKYDVAPHLQLRSITAWRGVTTDQWDNSGGAHRSIFAPNTNFSRYSLSYLRQTQFSQEFQAVGSAAQLDYAVGLYYFTERAREFAATPTTNKWNATGTGFTINDAQTWNMANWLRQRDSNAVAHSYAAFGQATYSPLDVVHITLGGRYTKDKRRGALTMISGVATPYTFTYDNSRFDPMATVAFDAAPNVNLYAKYATGYRAGGANARSSDFGAFGPEAVKSYEVGAKMDLLDRHVRLNLAGYIMDRTGTQIDFDFVDTNPFLADGRTANPNYTKHTENTRNAPGTSKIRGLEADLTVKAAEGLTLGASYAYTYTKVPATPNTLLPGSPLTQVFVVFTPRNAGSAFADYEVPVGSGDMRLRFHLDGNYADPVYSFQNETTRTDKSFVMNGRIALADIPMNDNGQRLTVSLWSRNLLNESYIYRRSAANSVPTVNNDGSLNYGGVLGDYANFNPPRTFGVEGTLNF
ncbi:TonB-dependent receptor [Sphingomonas ginsenosidimutans]|jgi:iron complex outermembrane receptor protein|uniref:TonB-dependent receptor n=1 Tax=Sphingomonas ginsenosidimutans TaxID=862134 RepID=A0A2A4HWE0_9SPHN|nr:TonB-dependent receptor [Sphingomonas ginsenosidimutans]PCG08209.1 TonB-dependent receptor [Sphingomonas ginsenosidimutans]